MVFSYVLLTTFGDDIYGLKKSSQNNPFFWDIDIHAK